MNILVTGSAGFIGYNFCNELLNSNNKKIKIIGIDNLNTYYSKKIKISRLKLLKKNKKFIFYNIDLSNKKKLKKIFEKDKIDEVYNFAAQAGVRYSSVNPDAYIQSNILGFSNIIILSKDHKVKKFFYASSSSVYGDSNRFPLNENLPLEPKNLYGKTKKFNEEIAETFYNNFKFKSIGLRFFTIFGEWGRPDMFLFKLLIANKKKARFNLNNNGNHFRDFTYIKDVIKILFKLRNKKISKNEIYNICSNNPVSLIKIIKLIKKDIRNAKIIKCKKQPEDIFKTHGQNKKIKLKTKFKKFTKFETALNNTVKWFVENSRIYN
tara:strand:+ start:119 stop:1084 length:966 start_codon:yes stop_codon:yes gene_type:complete